MGTSGGAGKSGRKGGRATGGEKTGGPNVRTYDVSGRITAIKNGKVTLQVPNSYFKASLKLELTDDPEIAVELIDPRSLMLVRPGDKVRAVGSQVGENVGRLQDIQIVLAAPLSSGGASKKKPATKSDRTPTRASPTTSIPRPRPKTTLRRRRRTGSLDRSAKPRDPARRPKPRPRTPPGRSASVES